MKNLFVFMILLFPLAVLSNGGGIVFYGVNAAGNPYFKNIPNVDILREDLLIRPEGEKIIVQVTYLFNNRSAAKIKDLHYTFPVDFWCLPGGEEPFLYPLDSVKVMKENIKQVEFICNGKSLPYKNTMPRQWERESYNYKMRVWYFTTLELPKGASQLIVRYELKSEEVDEGGLWQHATFSYDFSPAKTWGNGKIKEFSMVVDLSDRRIDVDAGDNFYLSEDKYPFVRKGKVYTYTARDFALENADPLFLSYTYNDYEANAIINRIPNADLIVKTSSNTSQYPVSNLTDWDLGSAWVSGKNGGVGEWIEISTKNKFRVSEIAILPGYYKSAETYRNNNRIKKVQAELFSLDGKVVYTQELEFPDNPYRTVSYVDFHKELQTAFSIEYDYTGFTGDDEYSSGKPWIHQKIRITILEVYKGNKFDDTCISEIFVNGKYLK